MNVGIIGCGAIARRAHLPAFKSIPNIEVISVADLRCELAQKVSKEFYISKYSEDYKEILGDPSIDIVSICTPTPTHYKIVLDAANSGKHILVEKPMCMTSKESLEILEALKENGVKLCVVHNYRYFSAVQNSLKRINSGYLGRIVSIQGRGLTHFPVGWTRETWFYESGGVLYDFAPHVVDLALFFSNDKPVTVSAVGGTFLQGDFLTYAQIQIGFNNGTAANVDVSWLTGTFLFDINVHGTGGLTSIDVRGNHSYELHGIPTPVDDIRNFTRKMISTAKGVLRRNLLIGPLSLYYPLIRDFIESIQKNRKPPVTPEDAANVVAVLEAAKVSIERKR
ncbi:MAG: Gfo/Idh/MocA family protein, partial [Candidatus Hodarchaeota archaeon]